MLIVMPRRVMKIFSKKVKKNLQGQEKLLPLQSRLKHGLVREHSSVGSERLPYKQRVGGSTPSAPTQKGFRGRFDREPSSLKRLKGSTSKYRKKCNTFSI